jgi:hypothetical protein
VDDIFSLVSGAGVPLRSVSIDLIGQDAPSAFLRLEPEDQFTRAAPASKEEVGTTTTSEPVAGPTENAADSNGAKEDKMTEEEDPKQEVHGVGKNKEEAGSEKKEAAASGGSEGKENKQDAKLAPTPPRPKAGDVVFKREEFFSDPDKVRSPPPSIPQVSIFYH